MAAEIEQPRAGYPSVSDRNSQGRLGGGQDSELDELCLYMGKEHSTKQINAKKKYSCPH